MQRTDLVVEQCHHLGQMQLLDLGHHFAMARDGTGVEHAKAGRRVDFGGNVADLGLAHEGENGAECAHVAEMHGHKQRRGPIVVLLGQIAPDAMQELNHRHRLRIAEHGCKMRQAVALAVRHLDQLCHGNNRCEVLVVGHMDERESKESHHRVANVGMSRQGTVCARELLGGRGRTRQIPECRGLAGLLEPGNAQGRRRGQELQGGFKIGMGVPVAHIDECGKRLERCARDARKGNHMRTGTAWDRLGKKGGKLGAAACARGAHGARAVAAVLEMVKVLWGGVAKLRGGEELAQEGASCSEDDAVAVKKR
eukprot:comp20298_c0_seq1/m.40446 comp20298_c0_seq1/g.40446  ORF comp20298_c0_seq1/g.40446 comp20298_c0_seq1/m.40446 type:complete len:310 (-) comp20298_c0_seq1:91-1020(-)